METDPTESASQIAEVADGEVHINRSLAPFTSYNIGGPAAIWVAPRTEQGIARTLKIIYKKRLPFFILGRGSNLLISDRRWPGVTLYLAFTVARFLSNENPL